MLWLLTLPLFVAINAAAVTAFAIDKRRAIEGEWRIAESTLLTLALIGGSPGAIWARARFRHKTRKQPFAMQLDLIFMVQAGLVVGLGAALLF